MARGFYTRPKVASMGTDMGKKEKTICLFDDASRGPEVPHTGQLSRSKGRRLDAKKPPGTVARGRHFTAGKSWGR
jgi:hypothetical protein